VELSIGGKIIVRSAAVAAQVLGNTLVLAQAAAAWA